MDEESGYGSAGSSTRAYKKYSESIVWRYAPICSSGSLPKITGYA